MDLELTLTHLLIVLVAARMAAELAERIHQPAVVIEILTGILIGPSLLGLVGTDNVLTFLGHLGAILLLFEVGMQVDLKALIRVGGGALRVAGIGVVAPMVLAFPVLRAMGLDQTTALFLAAGIAATSVGVTARVFGDLKMLASSEARTTLGAAVADDVIGLLILTVVVGVSSAGTLALVSAASIVVSGIAFVVAATAICIWAAPRLFATISERSSTEGTVMSLGLAFALALALLASAARLAPIVGAFIAGLAISSGEVRDDLRRRLIPVGHFFIPIFFLQIGIDTRIAAFSSPKVLAVAGVLAAIAVAGKLASGLGVGRDGGDRLLVGAGMVPRGEVGLIFAGIGLAEGILDDRYYGVLVAVVLLSTLIAPPWMRWRASHSRKRVARSRSISLEPQGGWLQRTGDEVELAAEPPEILAPQIGLEASIECAKSRPGPRLLQWLSSVSLDHVNWNPELREGFFALLRDGNERSWRFLEVTGLSSALLPAMERALQERRRNPFELDPAGALRWAILADLNASIREGKDSAVRVWERLEAKDVVRLAALARDAFDGQKNPAKLARHLAESIGLSGEEQELAAFGVAERHLLPAASARLPIRTEESVIELAVHLGTRERADALYVLAVAENAMHTWERERLDELFNLIQEALSHADLVSPAAESLIRRREAETIDALWYLPDMMVRRRLETLPRRYLLAQSPEIIARHLKMTKTIPERLEVRLEAEPVSPLGNWLVHVAALDRKGLLASVAGALASHEVSVVEAFVSTWRNGVAVDVFKVEAPGAVDWEEVRTSIAGRLAHASGNGATPIPIEGLVRIDNLASPWHTIVEVQAEDRRGLLYRVASALSRAGLRVHMATVSTVGDTAVDIFYVTGRNGAKLDSRGERDLRLAFSGKRAVKWRLPWRLESETTT